MTNSNLRRPRVRDARVFAPWFLKGSALLLVLAALAGCEGPGAGQLFSTDQTGNVDLQVFLDLNRNGTFDDSDRPLVGTAAALRFPGSIDTLAVDTTDAMGEVAFAGVPVGSLELLVETDPLSDSLVVSLRDPVDLRVTRDDQIPARFALSYPIVKITEAREWPMDRRIFVEGIALNSVGELPGTALHVRDESGWLRAEATTGAAVSSGDTIRLRGVIHREGASAVLRDAVRFSLPGEGRSVEPLSIGTQQARTAGSDLDGALIRIENATVLQTVFQGGTATSQITDGSGPLVLRIPSAQLLEAGLPIPTAGSRLSITGVLIPQDSGTQWSLRTRRGADVEITSTGSMTGRVFIPEPDDDSGEGGEAGNGALRVGPQGLMQDTPLGNVRVLVYAAELGGESLAQGFTDAEGLFRIDSLPTGNYLLELDPFTYPDSLSIGTIVPSPVRIETDQSTNVLVPLLRPDDS